MAYEVDILIDASKENVWRVITDIENSAKTISGIKKIEILDKSSNGLVGLKWEETRIMFGKTATEIMWITNVEDQSYYMTRAEHPGVVYITTLSVTDSGDKTHLTMKFLAEPLSLGAKFMSALMGIFIKKSMENTIKQDLIDIKTAAEIM